MSSVSKSRKSGTTRRRNSESGSNSAAQERLYARFAKKIGVKQLTEDQKRYIEDAEYAADSANASPDEKKVLKGLKGIKDIVANYKTAGKEAHNEDKARRTRRADRLKARYEAQKDEVATELRRLARKIGKKIPAKGTLHLAKLRAYGFKLNIAEHVHLTKHLDDRTTKHIKAYLRNQERSNHCAQCALEDYLAIV